MCNGKGDCRDGKCHCDIGYRGIMNICIIFLSKYSYVSLLNIHRADEKVIMKSKAIINGQ